MMTLPLFFGKAEAEALRAEEAELTIRAARLSGDLSRRSEAQHQLAALEDPAEDQRRVEALTAARAAPAEAEAHADRLGAAQRALALARATDDNARAESEGLETLSERAAHAARALAAATEDAARHDSCAAALSQSDRDTAAALRDAEALTRALRDRLALAQRARLARSLAKARLAAQSVSLSPAYSGAARVGADGADLPEGPRDLDLPGIGTMGIDPGAQTVAGSGDPAALTARLRDLRDARTGL